MNALTSFLIQHIPLFIAWSVAALILNALSVNSVKEITWRLRISQVFLWMLPAIMLFPSAENALPEAFPTISFSTDILVGAPESITESSSFGAINWFLIIWVGVAFLLVLRDLISYLRLSFRLGSLSTVLQNDDLSLVANSSVRLFTQSDNDLPPMTFGFLSPRIYIPDHISADSNKLPLVLDHELAHVRNHDFLFSFLERQWSHLLWFVPTVRLFTDHINYLRELRCDMNVVSNRNAKHYAELLLSVVEVNKNQTLVPAFASSYTHLKKRITMLTIERDTTYARLIKLLALFSGLFLMLIACDQMVSLGDGVELDASEMKIGMADSIHVVVDTPPQMIGGFSSLGKLIEYPQDARAEGVQGRVMVTFVVDEEGIPTNINTPTNKDIPGLTKSTADPRLVVAALDAVEKVRFTPGEHQGKPVKVRFALPVVFIIQSESEATSGE